MMKKIVKILSLLGIFLIASTLFCGCEVFLEGKTHSISGYVYFDGRPLEDVKITDKINVYTSTNADGYFKFSTKKTEIQIFPEKSGYMFTPQTLTVDGDKKIDFFGQKAQKLDGKIVLSKIVITPVSIVSFSDNNFLYNQNCLKINQLKVTINQTSFNNDTVTFATLNQQTDLIGGNSFEYLIEDGYINLKICYELSTFYTTYSHESIAVESQRILRTEKILDTGNIYEGKFEMHASGINSVHNGFSYNIAFVFDYIEN